MIFNFHGYPSAIHQLIHRRPRQERFHVRGYAEEGTTTTPFELLAMNGVDRYHLAIEALSRVDVAAAEDVHGLSGEFAVRDLAQAGDAIQKFKDELAAPPRRTCARRATTRPRSSTGPGPATARRQPDRPPKPRGRVVNGLYVTAMEARSGKSVAALGMMETALGTRSARGVPAADRRRGSTRRSSCAAAATRRA